MTKWRTLGLATAAFNLSFLIWFSFAPFTGPIAAEFGLNVTDLGILVSAAVWSAPVGRILVGWITDRYGATTTFSIVLAYAGVFSIASAFAQSYAVFFVERLVVASVGISFVIGVQHVSEWFPEEQLGTAEGIYAGIGNAGAAGGALVLPRLFGVDWRSAFLYTGVAALGMAVVYYVAGEDAATEQRRSETRDSATLKSWLHIATRYATIVLALGYVMSFGMEISMNGWLPTYFRRGFEANLVVASTFAAVFSLAAGLVRPLGGFTSDWLTRNEREILPVFDGRYREQWTFVCMCLVVVSLVVLTAAGRTGRVVLTVGAATFVGISCALTAGAIFAQVPAMFPNRSGAAAGVVGGIGTLGGVGFPLVFSAVATKGHLHLGYSVVAVVVLPIVLLNAWVYRPSIASRANVDGLVEVSVTSDGD